MKRLQTTFYYQQESGTSNKFQHETPLDYRSGVIDKIYDQMSRTPNAIALTDGDLEWTYRALRRRADTLAKSMASHGITRGSVVGMHLPRCADAIAVMLGVYLPLDPSYPSGRLRYMLDQAEASPNQLVVEPVALASELVVDTANREFFRREDCAYILFTSGSTGQPKGVMVTHENITQLSEWATKVLDLSPFDASATSCSLSFDPSFLEILLPLSVGGTVHVISHALALGRVTRPVSFVASTPTVAHELLMADQLPLLKVLIVGGEALAPDVAADLLSSGRVGSLFNFYGPTETTVAVTVQEITTPVPKVIPIGRQVPGTEVLILDNGGRPLPDGEFGEICVFGRQVSRGYVNDPAATAVSFAASQSMTAERQFYYRTGDLGYRTDDGSIYFTGRLDNQVKLNGIRIELGEIDVALRSHPQVSDAATIARQDGRAVAYVVPTEPTADVDVTAVRTYLSERLPRFMLPSGIVVVGELPQTVNGKLDTSALQEWSPGRAEGELPATGEEAEPDDYTARVIKIVAEVTGFTGQIRPSDDFIEDLGGTSLGIVRVLVELERYSGRRIPINDALADTSVAGIAGLLRQEVEPHAQNAVNRIREIRPTGQIAMAGHSAGGIIVLEAARKMLESGEHSPALLRPRVLLGGGDAVLERVRPPSLQDSPGSSQPAVFVGPVKEGPFSVHIAGRRCDDAE